MNIKKKIMAITAVAVLSIIGCIYLKDYMSYVSTDNAQITARTLMLSSKVPGFITSVNIREGDVVKKGQVLIEIDDRDLKNSLRQHQGELAALAAQRDDAERTLTRITNLYNTRAASRQQYDQAQALATGLRSKYQSLSAVVDQVKLNLENTRVKAPSSGFIAKTSAEVGQFTGSGIPLIGFVDASERWVVANFKETEISDIRVGAKVRIEVDAISGSSFDGEVESLNSATGSTFTLLPPDNATGNFTKVIQRIPVRIKILNLREHDIEKLRNGLSANVKVRKYS